jgi:hypothetical protein
MNLDTILENYPELKVTSPQAQAYRRSSAGFLAGVVVPTTYRPQLNLYHPPAATEVLAHDQQPVQLLYHQEQPFQQQQQLVHHQQFVHQQPYVQQYFYTHPQQAYYLGHQQQPAAQEQQIHPSEQPQQFYYSY